MRVLIVEDKPDLIELYLRIFGRILEGLDIEFDQVSSIEEALPFLTKECDIILMDADLGAPAIWPIGAKEEDGVKLSNGYDLVRFRRNQESVEKLKRSDILGITTNHVSSSFMMDSGATCAFLKLEIPEVAREIKARALKEKNN